MAPLDRLTKTSLRFRGQVIMRLAGLNPSGGDPMDLGDSSHPGLARRPSAWPKPNPAGASRPKTARGPPRRYTYLSENYIISGPIGQGHSVGSRHQFRHLEVHSVGSGPECVLPRRSRVHWRC